MGGGIYDQNINQHENIWFNNIIWGNQTNHFQPVHGIHLQTSGGDIDLQDAGYLEFGYNNIQDLSEIYSTYIDYPSLGTNTISVDPFFKSAGSFQLSDGRPMIGAGAPIFAGDISAPAIDIDGNRRPSPSGSNPDLGAYENALAKSPYPDAVQGPVSYTHLTLPTICSV